MQEKPPKVFRVRSTIGLTSFGCVKQSLEFCTEVRKLGGCNIPNNGVVNPKIIVYEPITHPGNLPPLDIRLYRLDIVW